MGLITISDEALQIVLPLASYWVSSAMYEAACRFVPAGKYRLYPREDDGDEKTNHYPTRWEVARCVLFNQGLQTALSVLFDVWLQGGGRPVAAPDVAVQPPLHVQAIQLLVAILVLDTWMYFAHRLLHANMFLYKHLHVTHHRIIAPYSFGAQYMHPLDGLLFHMPGVVLAGTVSCMTPRNAAFFFSLMAVKAIDDHCGLWLPGHPFHLVFSNTSAFHTVHHQLYGGKANFSTLFFTFWDKIMGTYMPYTVEERDEGGYELKPLIKGAAVKED